MTKKSSAKTTKKRIASASKAAPKALSLSKLQKIDAGHHLHPFSDNKEIAQQGSRVITKGKGIYITDAHGKELLDAMSGLWCVNLGYGNRRLVQAATEQMKVLPYYNHFFQCTTQPATELAQEIIDVAPKGMKKVFFTSSGSEAIDTALKLVWRYHQIKKQPKKRIIITRKNAYHGSTVAGASLGGMAFMHGQMDVINNIQHVSQPYWFEDGRSWSPSDYGVKVAEDLEKKINKLGPENIAAFFAEPVQGAGGVIIPAETYWPRVRKILEKHNILFVADEVITGFGRLGNWFGSQTYNLKPDLMTFAKGVTSGYIPLGGVIVGGKVDEALATGGDFNHGYTYSGHPVACAVGLANMREIKRLSLIEKTRTVTAPYFAEAWAGLSDHLIVGEARVKGMMAAIELVVNKRTMKRIGDKDATGVVCRNYSLEEGIVMRACGGAMVVAPPLTITKKEIDLLVERAWSALDRTKRHFEKAGLI